MAEPFFRDRVPRDPPGVVDVSELVRREYPLLSRERAGWIYARPSSYLDRGRCFDSVAIGGLLGVGWYVACVLACVRACPLVCG